MGKYSLEFLGISSYSYTWPSMVPNGKVWISNISYGPWMNIGRLYSVMSRYVLLWSSMSPYDQIWGIWPGMTEFGPFKFKFVPTWILHCGSVIEYDESIAKNSPVWQVVTDCGQLWPIIDQVCTNIAKYVTVWLYGSALYPDMTWSSIV